MNIQVSDIPSELSTQLSMSAEEIVSGLSQKRLDPMLYTDIINICDDILENIEDESDPIINQVQSLQSKIAKLPQVQELKTKMATDAAKRQTKELETEAERENRRKRGRWSEKNARHVTPGGVKLRGTVTGRLGEGIEDKPVSFDITEVDPDTYNPDAITKDDIPQELANKMNLSVDELLQILTSGETITGPFYQLLTRKVSAILDEAEDENETTNAVQRLMKKLSNTEQGKKAQSKFGQMKRRKEQRSKLIPQAEYRAQRNRDANQYGRNYNGVYGTGNLSTNKANPLPLEESYSPLNHKYGKVPGGAKEIDKFDATKKQKKLIESGWDKYMKTKKIKNDDDTTNPFSIVLG